MFSVAARDHGEGIIPGLRFQVATPNAIREKRPELEDFVRRLTAARAWSRTMSAPMPTHGQVNEYPARRSAKAMALARALVSRPRVLAFDEPLGALDALTRISVKPLRERVWQDQGFTAILVTHDVAKAVALADRVLVIEDGGIAHDIDVDIPRPRRRGSAELAALEGSILKNILQGTEDTSYL